MAQSSPKAAGGGSRRAASPADKRAQRQGTAAKRVEQQQADTRLLDSRARRDIAGVLCVVAAIALFVITTMPVNGLVTTWLSGALHASLGIGCMLLPMFLVLIAVSLFFRTEGRRIPLRVAIGLLLMFVAILVLFALYTPGLSMLNLDLLFAEQSLTSQGGYVGAGIAWVLMTLFGHTVSVVLTFGLIAISLIVIGVSLRPLFDKVREVRDASFSDGFMAASQMPPAQVQRASAPQARPRRSQRSAADDGFSEAPTIVLGRKEPARASSKEPASGAITRKLGKKPAAQKTEAATEVLEKPRPVAKKRTGAPQPSEGFVLPSMDLLEKTTSNKKRRESEDMLRDTAMLLQDTLADFGVHARVVDWIAGPTVTLFKVDLPAGIRVSKVTNLQDDIALALAAQGVRIFAPIPGTNYVGIEVPNSKPQTVLLGDILPAAGPGPLEMVVGEDVEGHRIVDDLSKMPHLLVAGTTGSGKSVAINGMIMSILMRATPAEVRFIMIDPKRVEFTPYNGIPHLYVPVVTECREAASALSWAVAEMERRLKVFAKVGARNIAQYNSKAQKGMKIGEEQAEEIPYIVIVIDELADLMMNVGKEVEFSISRLAQLARAAGIHMIIATQRPSTNVVTGLIKANITCRIALNVASGIDSRVILDSTGAENLIGNGDMLYSKPEYPKPVRLQGCFTSNNEIEQVVAHLKQQGEPEYHQEILQTNLITMGQADASGASGGPADPLLWEAAEIVVSSGVGSTSNVQRRLSVGYSRAGRIMDMLEEKGIVGPQNGSKPREVLVDAMELESLKAFEASESDLGE